MTATKKNSKKTTKRDANLVPLTEAMGTKGGKAKKATNPPILAKTEAARGKLSLLDAAAQVLKGSKAAMNCKGMIEAIFAKKLWHSDAPTPAATLSSAILREMQNKKAQARFKKVDRGQFAYAG